MIGSFQMGDEARGGEHLLLWQQRRETAASERTKWAAWLRDLLEGQRGDT